MVGVGRTVFEGSELQDFKVHILGVLRNVQGPKRNLILARLEGGPLASTGVAPGHERQPGLHRRPADRRGLLLDRRVLEGADRRDHADRGDEGCDGDAAGARARSRSGSSCRSRARTSTAALSATYGRLTPFANRPADVQAIGIPAAAGAQMGAMLRPISTPLLMGGFEPEIADLVAGAFRESGFTPIITGAASAELQSTPEVPLREGDAIGVSLIGGDLEMGATGTVTHIDGDRVYAFGHPLYNLGPAEFPMTRAHVYMMLPSLMTSFKISSLGETIGTLQQDRATAIAGTLGKGPALVPMTVTSNPARGGGAGHAHGEAAARQGSAVHAAARLRLHVQHPGRLRASVRRRDDCAEKPHPAEGPWRSRGRGCLRDGEPDSRRLDGGRGPADDDAREQHLGGDGREHRRDGDARPRRPRREPSSGYGSTRFVRAPAGP